MFGEQQCDMIIPVYVGISRNIYDRLRQHGWGRHHKAAKLAYLIATEKY